MLLLARNLLVVLASVLVSGLAQAETWRIIVLPDTQNYVNLDNDFDLDGTSDYLHHFQNQVDWIVANQEALNIVFVSHTGDIVQRVHLINPPIEWLDADEALSGLDGVVPYGAVAGNHDILNSGLFPFNYLIFFGPSRYASYPWYGGSSPNELSHYQLFQVQGDYGLYRFTHISAEWQLPGSVNDPDSSLGWVQDVIDRQSKLSNILFSTHATIDTDGQWGTQTWNLLNENTPDEIRLKLFEPNFREIDLIFSGHYHTTTDAAENLEVRQTPVLMADYQSYPEGGQGYLRIIEFIEGGGSANLDRIQVRTYSPSLDKYLIDSENSFAIDRDFKKLFQPQADAIPLPVPSGRGVTPG